MGTLGSREDALLRTGTKGSPRGSSGISELKLWRVEFQVGILIGKLDLIQATSNAMQKYWIPISAAARIHRTGR
jgi:hypothetical protein